MVLLYPGRHCLRFPPDMIPNLCHWFPSYPLPPYRWFRTPLPATFPWFRITDQRTFPALILCLCTPLPLEHLGCRRHTAALDTHALLFIPAGFDLVACPPCGRRLDYTLPMPTYRLKHLRLRYRLPCAWIDGTQLPRSACMFTLPLRFC